VPEVAACDAELEAVPLQVALDARKLQVRLVIGLDGVIEARVDLLDLREYLLRLPLLRRDRSGIGGGCTRRGEGRSENDDQGSRLPPTGVDTRLRCRPPTSAPGGAGTSQVGHPSKCFG
jgi:hypothetical protein